LYTALIAPGFGYVAAATITATATQSLQQNMYIKATDGPALPMYMSRDDVSMQSHCCSNTQVQSCTLCARDSSEKLPCCLAAAALSLRTAAAITGINAPVLASIDATAVCFGTNCIILLLSLLLLLLQLKDLDLSEVTHTTKSEPRQKWTAPEGNADDMDTDTAVVDTNSSSSSSSSSKGTKRSMRSQQLQAELRALAKRSAFETSAAMASDETDDEVGALVEPSKKRQKVEVQPAVAAAAAAAVTAAGAVVIADSSVPGSAVLVKRTQKPAASKAAAGSSSKKSSAKSKGKQNAAAAAAAAAAEAGAAAGAAAAAVVRKGASAEAVAAAAKAAGAAKHKPVKGSAARRAA
jgi:hypothetical protein